jgi:hypothetical protein
MNQDCVDCGNCTDCIDCFCCTDCAFCINCTYCIGCVDWHNKQYCINNVQYTRDEYYAKVGNK